MNQFNQIFFIYLAILWSKNNKEKKNEYHVMHLVISNRVSAFILSHYLGFGLVYHHRVKLCNIFWFETSLHF
jgi:hypothetical protein